MPDSDDEPTTQTTDKGQEIPVPTGGDWDKTLGKVVRSPGRPRVPKEVVDAAEQEADLPADETDEG
jgi:hypothetical protein